MISDIVINQNTTEENIGVNTEENIGVNTEQTILFSNGDSSNNTIDQPKSLVSILSQNKLVETPATEKIEIELIEEDDAAIENPTSSSSCTTSSIGGNELMHIN